MLNSSQREPGAGSKLRRPFKLHPTWQAYLWKARLLIRFIIRTTVTQPGTAGKPTYHHQGSPPEAPKPRSSEVESQHQLPSRAARLHSVTVS